MYLTELRAEGFQGGDAAFEAEAGFCELPSGAAGARLLDALTLLRVTFQPDSLPDLGALFGGPYPLDPEISEGVLAGVSAPEGWDLSGLARPGTHQHLRVYATLQLDPPAWGRLREHALRDPRLAEGLAQRTISISCGWLFGPDRRSAAVHIGPIALGPVEVPPTGLEAPKWGVPFVRSLLDRVGGRDALDLDGALSLFRAARFSDDPEQRERARAAAAALAEPPFSLGQLDLVLQDGARWSFTLGPDLLRPRTFGPAAAEWIRLVVQVFLTRPDVLVGHTFSPHTVQRDPLHAWLDQMCSAADAPMEQVLSAPGPSP